MNDTPETDEQVNGKPCTQFGILSGNSLRDSLIPSIFARKLERERDEARAELSLKFQSVTIASGTISDLLKKSERREREREEAIKQIHEEARDYESQIRKLCEAYNDLAERNAKLKAYFIQKSDSAERERDEAQNNLKITQEAFVKAKVERVEALRERDEARATIANLQVCLEELAKLAQKLKDERDCKK
jgi:hypothetical protein